jgi:hypothetical protein
VQDSKVALEDTTDTKKKPETGEKTAEGDNKDPKKTGTDQTTTASGDKTGSSKIESDGIMCWGKDLFNEACDVWHGVFGRGEQAKTSIEQAKASAIKVDDINSLSFDNIFGTGASGTTAPGTKGTDATATTKTGDTTKTADATSGGGLFDWISHGFDSATSAVKGAMDWMAGGTSKDGTTTKIESKDGTVHADVTTKNGDHVEAQTKPGEQVVKANDVTVAKNDKGTAFDDGVFHGTVDKNGKQVLTDKRTGHTYALENGSYVERDTDGKVVSTRSPDQFEKDWNGMHVSQVTDIAAQARHLKDHPEINDPKQVYVDGHGNYLFVRDGIIFKRMADGTLEFERRGDFDHDGKDETQKVRVHGHHAYAVVVDPATGQEKEVPISGREPRWWHTRKDGGMEVNGQQVVDDHGRLHDRSTGTVIDNKTGTATSDTGVKITSANGQSKVEDQTGASTTRKDDGSVDEARPGGPTVHYDPKQGLAVETPDHHIARLGPDGMKFVEPDGQTTTLNKDGSACSTNKDGQQLFNLDSQGNLTLADGTHIDANGHVYNESLGIDKQAWGSDSPSYKAAESIASGTVTTSQAAIDSVAKKFGGNDVVTDADVSNLGSALSSCSAAIQACIQSGNYDALAQVLSVQGTLQGVMGTAQTLASLYGNLKGSLSNSEIAEAQKNLYGKTLAQAENDAEARHQGTTYIGPNDLRNAS